MVIVAPTHTAFYHPTAPADDHSKIHVWANPDVIWPGTFGRPWVIISDGGGWNTDSGTPLANLDSETAPLTYRLWERGIGIVSLGYDVNPTPIDASTIFDDSKFTVGGAGTIYTLNSAQLGNRCAEISAVHAIQYIRFVGIADLDKTPGKNGAFAKSAGDVTLGFLLVQDRADPAATLGTRYRTSTKLGWHMGLSALPSVLAWLDALTVQHWSGTDPSGINIDIGDAKNFSGGTPVMRHDSYLWVSTATATNRQIIAQTPVWLESNAAITFAGSPAGTYTFSNIINQCSAAHPSESIKAAQQTWLNLATLYPAESFTNNVHPTESVFRPENVIVGEQADEDRYQWILARFGLEDFTETLIVEDGTAKPDANSYASLDSLQSYIDQFVGNATAWDALDVNAQQDLAMQATQWIELTFKKQWRGTKYTKAQALSWPRIGVVTPDGFEIYTNEVPVDLKCAQAEVCVAAAANPTLPLGGPSEPTVGVGAGEVVTGKSIKVGAIEKSTAYASGNVGPGIGAYGTQGAGSLVYAKVRVLLSDYLKGGNIAERG